MNVIDKIENAVTAVYLEALMEGNLNVINNGIPLIGIGEEESFEIEVDGSATELPVTVSTSYVKDIGDEHIPRTLAFNKKVVKDISMGNLTELIKEIIAPENTLVGSDIESDEGIKLSSYTDELSFETNSFLTKKFIVETEEGETTTSTPKPIDMSKLKDFIKDMSGEELEDEPKTLVDDSYKIKHEKPKLEKSDISKDLGYYAKPISEDCLEVLTARSCKVKTLIENGIKAKGIGKRASNIPSKKMHIRNTIIDNGSNEYVSRVVDKGKNINIVLVLDRSGSMSGTPTEESVILIHALNEIAYDNDKFKCSVIFSDTDNSDIIDLPTTAKKDSSLLTLQETHSAEGLEENMKVYKDRLDVADVVFTYTDGCIEDGSLDKPYYTSRGIELIGLYTTGEELTSDVYAAHYNRNKSWFHKVLISNTMEQLVEKMIPFLKGK